MVRFRVEKTTSGFLWCVCNVAVKKGGELLRAAFYGFSNQAMTIYF